MPDRCPSSPTGRSSTSPPRPTPGSPARSSRPTSSAKVGNSSRPGTDRMTSLPLDEVHVWTASRDVPEDAVEAFRALLNDDERRRADRFAFPHDRRRFAVGRGLLRTILGRYLDRPPESLRFIANAHGKPRLDPALDIDLPIRFNLAHSGPRIVYALT